MSTVVVPPPKTAVVERRVSVVVVREKGGLPAVTRQGAGRSVVVTRGVRGLQGPPGGGAGATYTHAQAIASAVWTVAHNLGRRPSVAVTDHLGNQIWPDVRWVDDNLVQVTHGTPLTGFAYCN